MIFGYQRLAKVRVRFRVRVRVTKSSGSCVPIVDSGRFFVFDENFHKNFEGFKRSISRTVALDLYCGSAGA